MAIPRWAHLLFGTLEPLVNVATAVFITCNAALFNQLLFAAAPTGSEVDLALARMYASVLLCFGLCQYCAWSTWAADENAKPRVRAWTLTRHTLRGRAVCAAATTSRLRSTSRP